MKCFNYFRCIVHSSDGEELFFATAFHDLQLTSLAVIVIESSSVRRLSAHSIFHHHPRMDRGGGVAKRDHDLFENCIAIDV